MSIEQILGGAVAGFLIKLLIDLFRERGNKHESKTEKNTEAINILNMSVARLEIAISHLEDKISLFIKLRQDVDHAFVRIRDMEKDNEQ